MIIGERYCIPLWNPLVLYGRMRLVREGPPPPSFQNRSIRHVSSRCAVQNRSIRHVSSRCAVVAPPIGIECRTNSSGLRLEIVYSLQNSSKNTTVPHHSCPLATTIRGKEGVVHKIRET